MISLDTYNAYPGSGILLAESGAKPDSDGPIGDDSGRATQSTSELAVEAVSDELRSVDASESIFRRSRCRSRGRWPGRRLINQREVPELLVKIILQLPLGGSNEFNHFISSLAVPSLAAFRSSNGWEY